MIALATGVSFVVATGLSAALGRRKQLLLLGALLGLGAFWLAYAFADRSFSESQGCSDCERWLDRWWEPRFVGFVIALAYGAWLVGILAGWAGRRALSSARA